MIPVLLYHGVPSRAAGRDRLAVPRDVFLQHLDAIVDSGRRCVTIGELAAGFRGALTLPERAVAVTFDDGYADTPDAIELLRARGLRATVFITTGLVGAPAMISSDQLATLAEQPATVELGAHTVTHPHLDELSRHEMDTEILGSKQQLEAALGQRVDSFAYPYGAYDASVRAAVAAAGFAAAAAVKNALSHRRDDPLAIARWTVGSRTSAQRIASLLDGEGAPRAWREERLRTRSYRSARRLRRAVSRGLGR